MFFLMAHYRSFQDFTWESLTAAQTARLKLQKKLSGYDTTGEVDKEIVSFLMEMLADDLDTPKMLARLFACMDVMDDGLPTAIKWLDDSVLRLDLFGFVEAVIPDDIKQLADQRRDAKQSKDRKAADALRDQLAALGWKMLDGKDSYELEKL